MWHPFVAQWERVMLWSVSKPGRFDAPLPLRERPSWTPARFVLEAPVASVSLGASGPPLAVERFAFPTAAPVADGSGDVATGFVVRPRGAPRRAILLVPGWLASFQPWFRWHARRLARRGALVAVLDLPAHFDRTPPSARHGVRFFCGDPTLTASYLRAALSDARAIVRALARASGGTPVVATGFSLGGWLAGMAASLESDVAAVLVTPAADLGRLLSSSPLLGEVRNALWRAGHDPEALVADCAPLALERFRAPARGALLLGAADDAAIPGATLVHLASAWKCPLELLPVGHLTPYVSPAFLSRFARAVEAWG